VCVFLYSYYLFCVGSRTGGNLILSVQARMHETTLTSVTSSLVLDEIQRIDVNATVIPEHQVDHMIILSSKFRIVLFSF
jgi:hypothetical protein